MSINLTQFIVPNSSPTLPPPHLGTHHPLPLFLIAPTTTPNKGDQSERINHFGDKVLGKFILELWVNVHVQSSFRPPPELIDNKLDNGDSGT